MSRGRGGKAFSNVLQNSGLVFGAVGTNICKEDNKGWFCQFQRFFSFVMMALVLIIIFYLIYKFLNPFASKSKKSKIN